MLDDLDDSSAKRIQELEDTIRKLEDAVNTDITTKIGNRSYFIKKAVDVLSRKSDYEYTLVGFEVANLAKVNRMFGPTESDRLISYVAKRLRELTPIGSFYAIVQTGVFALLLPSQKDEAIHKFVSAMTEDISSCTDILQIDLHFGIYKLEDKAEKVSEILSRMMLALRTVSDRDKDNFVYFDDDLRQKFEDNNKMCEEMEQALVENKFLMYLQPVVDLRQNIIVSAEAFVRWEHPEKGLLSPYVFLPVFENTNLMLKLDYYMWEEACKTIRRWIDNKLEPYPIMLNISPIHLDGVSFLNILNGLVDKYKIKKDMLILELPEDLLSSGNTDIAYVVTSIVETGYHIAIDNFGGHHSPINLLADLPISMVKLDRGFHTNNSRNMKGETILRYLVAMAKELDLTVVAESVENQEQLNFLSEIGCDMAQGYCFSKPVDIREFDKLSKKVSRQGFRANEYYPVFEDIEKDIDIMEKMLTR